MPKIKAKKPTEKTHIIIQNARTHNLKGVSVSLPRGAFIVITGLSGSGKSSLAFDTLYAEGQRRYVESLSSYARQFLDKMDKPEVDAILGISPAIAIEQKVTSRTSRSTVGTSTEIYDYLKLLYARIGRTFSPISGEEVKRETTADVLDYIKSLDDGEKLLIAAPLVERSDRSTEQQLDLLIQQGYARLWIDGKVGRIADTEVKDIDKADEKYIVVDRLTHRVGDEENDSRLADSVETAYFEGQGECRIISVTNEKNTRSFSSKFEKDGMTFEIPTEHFFTFNNPVGACKTCEGFGSVIGIDPDAVIPNKQLSVYEDAVVAWRGEKMSEWKNQFIAHAGNEFPIHRPIKDLSESELDLLWTGKGRMKGLNAFFKYLESKSYKIQYRVMLSRYRGKTVCPDCKGSRIRKDAQYVKIDGYSLIDIIRMPVSQSGPIFKDLKLNEFEASIAKRLLVEIQNRLGYLCDVGLGYLTLDRMSNTLSGGESQRIRLATSLGSSLVGSMYVLDEPSIGLHPHDTQKLIGVLKSLQKIGNTVIVVEHDEEIMRAADEIIDIGPMAGNLGGEVVFQGGHAELLTAQNSLTADYLTGRKSIHIPAKKRTWKDSIVIKGARTNNLKNIDVAFPLNCLVTVSGVSGSGKSTLVTQVVKPALEKKLDIFGTKLGDFDSIEGEYGMVKALEFVDQNPIGKSSRSNPVTYVKAFDEIRSLFASEKLSQVRGYKPSHFSFNVKGGRCETCEGEGVVKIGMQFMADIHLKCEACNGKRYKKETLEIKYRGKDISEVLEMTVDEAVDFFASDSKSRLAKKVWTKLLPLQKVGLGYVQLGQSSSTLSGGEAQRTKLAAFLAKGEQEPHTLFIFDEPTTGLHFDDVGRLLDSFNELLNRGHSIWVIEHNQDVIRASDWVIDLGPGGGKAGGNLVFTGTPEDIVNSEESLTGKYLRK